MSEMNKEELKPPTQEERAEKSTQEKSATSRKNKPIWRHIAALYELAVEDVTPEELQAACIRLSEYINNNISDILKLREENDLLSGELRTAMAKLRAA